MSSPQSSSNLVQGERREEEEEGEEESEWLVITSFVQYNILYKANIHTANELLSYNFQKFRWQMLNDTGCRHHCTPIIDYCIVMVFEKNTLGCKKSASQYLYLLLYSLHLMQHEVFINIVQFINTNFFYVSPQR